MTDARSPRPVPQMTCPSCGSAQPSAHRCRDCGAPVAQVRPTPVLKGRERALAAASRRGGRRGLTHWTAWIAYAAVLAPIGALVWLNGQDGTPSDPAVAALETEMGRGSPELLRLRSEDPDAYSQVRGEIALALRSGRSQQEAMAQGLALLRELLRARGSATAEAKAGGTAPADGSDPMTPGEPGIATGVGRRRIQGCSAASQDADCLERLDDPDSLPHGADGRAADVARALERADAYRRKANQSAEILEGL